MIWNLFLNCLIHCCPCYDPTHGLKYQRCCKWGVKCRCSNRILNLAARNTPAGNDRLEKRESVHHLSQLLHLSWLYLVNTLAVSIFPTSFPLNVMFHTRLPKWAVPVLQVHGQTPRMLGFLHQALRCDGQHPWAWPVCSRIRRTILMAVRSTHPDCLMLNFIGWSKNFRLPGCHRPYPKMDQPKLDFHDAPPMAPKLDKILRRLIWLGAPKVPKSILLWSQCWLQSPMFRQRSAGNKSLQVMLFPLLTPFFWKKRS